MDEQTTTTPRAIGHCHACWDKNLQKCMGSITWYLPTTWQNCRSQNCTGPHEMDMGGFSEMAAICDCAAGKANMDAWERMKERAGKDGPQWKPQTFSEIFGYFPVHFKVTDGVYFGLPPRKKDCVKCLPDTRDFSGLLLWMQQRAHRERRAA